MKYQGPLPRLVPRIYIGQSRPETADEGDVWSAGGDKSYIWCNGRWMKR